MGPRSLRAAWMRYVGMNIGDKRKLYAEIGRLVSGAFRVRSAVVPVMDKHKGVEVSGVGSQAPT